MNTLDQGAEGPEHARLAVRAMVNATTSASCESARRPRPGRPTDLPRSASNSAPCTARPKKKRWRTHRRNLPRPRLSGCASTSVRMIPSGSERFGAPRALQSGVMPCETARIGCAIPRCRHTRPIVRREDFPLRGIDLCHGPPKFLAAIDRVGTEDTCHGSPSPHRQRIIWTGHPEGNRPGVRRSLGDIEGNFGCEQGARLLASSWRTRFYQLPATTVGTWKS